MNNLSPAKILHCILDDLCTYPKDYTFIILGKDGPTGKTWLCNALIDNGYKTFDVSESTFDLAEYRDNDNHHCRVNHVQHFAVIVLNRRLDLKGEQNGI